MWASEAWWKHNSSAMSPDCCLFLTACFLPFPSLLTVICLMEVFTTTTNVILVTAAIFKETTSKRDLNEAGKLWSKVKLCTAWLCSQSRARFLHLKEERRQNKDFSARCICWGMQMVFFLFFFLLRFRGKATDTAVATQERPLRHHLANAPHFICTRKGCCTFAFNLITLPPSTYFYLSSLQ